MTDEPFDLEAFREKRIREQEARIASMGLQSDGIIGGQLARPVVVNGKRYRSVTDAYLDTGIHEKYIREMCHGRNMHRKFTASFVEE